MSMFVVDTNVLSSVSEEILSLVSEANSLCDSVRSYDTNCDGKFNFEGARNVILHNLESCSTKIANTSKLIETVVNCHTTLQNDFVANNQSGTSATSVSTGGNSGVSSSTSVEQTSTTSESVTTASQPVVNTSPSTNVVAATPVSAESSVPATNNVESTVAQPAVTSYNGDMSSQFSSNPVSNTGMMNGYYPNNNMDESMYSNGYVGAASAAGLTAGSLYGLNNSFFDSSYDNNNNNYNDMYNNDRLNYRQEESTMFDDGADFSKTDINNKSDKSDKFEVTEVETPLREIGYAYVDEANLSDEAYEFVNSSDFSYDESGYAKVGERYVISCDSSVGKVGDVIQFVKEDNSIVECVIGVSTTTSKNTNKVNFIISEDAISSLQANEVSKTLLSDNKTINNCCNYNIYDKMEKNMNNNNSFDIQSGRNTDFWGGEIIDG